MELKIGDEVKVFDLEKWEFSPITGTITANGIKTRKIRVCFPPSGKSQWFRTELVRAVSDTEKYCIEVTVGMEVGTAGAQLVLEHKHGSDICEHVRLALECAVKKYKVPYGESGVQLESF